MLDGYLIAYLNLDEVIRIIRAEDEPKPVLMKRFKLSDVQAEAILNMRLRSLRKLEEFEIRGEHAELTKEGKGIEALLKSEEKQWEAIADEIRAIRKTFGPDTPLGRRRTSFAEAPAAEIEEAMLEASVEREPITVVVSEKGWIRALKGHVTDTAALAFKGDDALKFAFPAQTTDKVLVASTGGRFYTLQGDKLPGGRGHGEPIRLLVDMDAAEDVVAVFVHDPERKLLVASTEGRGFVVPEAEMLANTRKGKQVMSRRRAGGDAALRRRHGRHGGDARREPEAPPLPARPDPRDDARQGRAAAALQGRRHRRRARLRQGRRADLDEFVRPELRPFDGRAEGLGRRPRPGRTPAAVGLPALEPVRDAGDRIGPRPERDRSCSDEQVPHSAAHRGALRRVRASAGVRCCCRGDQHTSSFPRLRQAGDAGVSRTGFARRHPS